MRRGAPVVCVAVMALAGCANPVAYIPLVVPPRPMISRRPEQVDVLLVTPPARPHMDIGFLQIACPYSEDPNRYQELIRQMRGAAAVVGCDAVLIISATAVFGRGRSGGSMQASCEVYTDVKGG
jgi:hypothetical protein